MLTIAPRSHAPEGLRFAHQPAAPQVSPQPQAVDSFTPRFGASHQIATPNSPESSRFVNQGMTVNSVRELVERIDEAMTVTGEVYSGQEAFTGVFHVKFDRPSDLDAVRELDLDTRVEYTDGPRMVLKTRGKNPFLPGANDPVTAWANFTAVNRAELRDNGKMQVSPVTPLSVDAAGQADNDTAKDWNNKLFGFYKGVSKRLAPRDDSADLGDLREQRFRTCPQLKKTNLYVTPQMLNKKQTGHGGVAAAMAIDDMAKLSRLSLTSGTKPQLQEFTANYLAPFDINDALQYDTTLDHIAPDGTMVLSTRISKLDTETRKVTGPIILVHAAFRSSDASRLPQTIASPDVFEAEPSARELEAQAWLEAIR